MASFEKFLADSNFKVLYKTASGDYKIEVVDENFTPTVVITGKGKNSRFPLEKLGAYYSDGNNKFYSEDDESEISYGELTDRAVEAHLFAQGGESWVPPAKDPCDGCGEHVFSDKVKVNGEAKKLCTKCCDKAKGDGTFEGLAVAKKAGAHKCEECGASTENSGLCTTCQDESNEFAEKEASHKVKATGGLTCPNCGGTHIQPAFGHKLNKCLSCHFAFDSDEGPEDDMEMPDYRPISPADRVEKHDKLEEWRGLPGTFEGPGGGK